MNTTNFKNRLLITLFGIFSLGLTSQSFSQNSNQQDLVFVANFDSYDNWYNRAFKPDTERRSNYCKENLTKVGKIDNNSAIISISDFDLTRMEDFVSDAEMAKLMKANNITHDEVYMTLPLDKPGKAKPSIVNLLFKIKTIDYDLWYNNAFLKDTNRRKNFCDDSKTKVAKVSDKEAIVILYDFKLDKLWEFGGDKEVEKLMKAYQVEHKIEVLQKL